MKHSMMPIASTPSMRRVLVAATLIALAGTAAADRESRVALSPAYVAECGSCHVAFPPSLLSAGSWQRLMGSLDRHFGTDAVLDPGTARELTAWLTAHAGSGKRVVAAPPEDRLTRSAWFTREHREVPASTWTLPAVKRPANCAACQPRAEQGSFDEHDIRLPR